jgi:hypothetical protein
MPKWTETRPHAEEYRAHGYHVSVGQWVRAEMVRALYAYADEGAPLGGFLQAVVNNDFTLALGRADVDNARNIFGIRDFMLAEMPGRCHGFQGAYDDWRNTMAAQRNARPKSST